MKKKTIKNYERVKKRWKRERKRIQIMFKSKTRDIISFTKSCIAHCGNDNAPLRFV